MVRGAARVLYRGLIGTRRTVVAGLLQATSLPFIVAASMIGVELGVIGPATSAALIGAGLLSVLLFPLIAATILGRAGRPETASGARPRRRWARRPVSGAPSGEQVALRHGPWSATVVEVGGGLRELSHDGAPVLDGYPAGEMASGGRGQPLLPWPNRMAGGRYRFAEPRHPGPDQRAPTGSAIHGLTRWSSWRAAERGADRCAMTLRLHPQPAYPFTLDLRLDYALGDDGLDGGPHRAQRRRRPAALRGRLPPLPHAGRRVVDDARLHAAGERLAAGGRARDPHRRAPPGEAPPTSAAAGPIGDAVLDHCLTGLARDADGRAACA